LQINPEGSIGSITSSRHALFRAHGGTKVLQQALRFGCCFFTGFLKVAFIYNLLIILFNIAGFLMNPAYFIPNKRQVSCIVALKIQGEYI
jgi:hypothetical protein